MTKDHRRGVLDVDEKKYLQHGDLISVIVPIFNRAHLVQKSIGSILAQSYKNLDIVVVDDGSRDDLEKSILELNDPRIRLIRRDINGGAAAARNTGILAAKGEWITFHDSDDVCAYNRIDLAVHNLSSVNKECIGVYGMVIFYNEVDEQDYKNQKVYVRPFPTTPLLSDDLFHTTLESNTINIPTLLVRKETVLRAGLFDEKLRQNEDWDLCLRLTRLGKIGFVPKPFIFVSISLDPNVAATRVSKSKRQAARSFARITGKLRHEGFKEPALAHHYATTAQALLFLGKVKPARRFLKASLSINPLVPKVWIRLALTYTIKWYGRG